ncbi:MULTISPECIES: hypothetical protein [Giesbergeria]|uniref:Uncharacterized protein n=1 Tax=Giesbergeria sinuosa TaxID=80883 RepID=A0ABV9QE70_9BURK
MSDFDQETMTQLRLIYQDMRWLADRDHVGPKRARAWYSAVMNRTVGKKVCFFTGKVSEKAVLQRKNLVFEHFERLSSSLSQLLEKHKESNASEDEGFNDFVNLIKKCERVNITTNKENDEIKKAEGNYEKAGVVLIDWSDIKCQNAIRAFKKKIAGGNIANAKEFL